MSGILLVHGAWHGPWCWDGFVARLAERGHDVRAVRLRGHDRLGGRIWHRLHHYLEDVQRAVESFAEPPVLVGHSMGGLLAQEHARRHPVRAVVLLASLAPESAIPVAARLALRHPRVMAQATLRLRLRPFVATRAQTRALFFTDDTPQAIVDRCHAKLGDESYLAFLDMLVPALRRPEVRAPVLVLGASDDAIISTNDVRRTARAYNTQAQLFDGMGHDMMLEDGWERVADRIDAYAAACVARETTSRVAHSRRTAGSVVRIELQTSVRRLGPRGLRLHHRAGQLARVLAALRSPRPHVALARSRRSGAPVARIRDDGHEPLAAGLDSG